VAVFIQPNTSRTCAAEAASGVRTDAGKTRARHRTVLLLAAETPRRTTALSRGSVPEGPGAAAYLARSSARAIRLSARLTPSGRFSWRAIRRASARGGSLGR
jgi:hypothetical protein